MALAVEQMSFHFLPH